MRKRLVLAASALSALALAAPGALASSTAVLDGKKVTSLTLTATATAQDHDSDLVTGSAGLDPARVDCTAPRCAILPFVYKPAKGVKGDVAFSLTWGTPGSDFDLYVVQLGKGGRTQVATCGASAGLSEKVFLDASNFRAGKTYGLLVDFYRTPGETVTGKVQMPGTDTVSTTVPSAVESGSGFNINCGL